MTLDLTAALAPLFWAMTAMLAIGAAAILAGALRHARTRVPRTRVPRLPPAAGAMPNALAR